MPEATTHTWQQSMAIERGYQREAPPLVITLHAAAADMRTRPGCRCTCTSCTHTHARPGCRHSQLDRDPPSCAARLAAVLLRG